MQRRQMLIERKKQTAAFTLVELLVVIAIIAMLVSVLLPAIQASRSNARRTQCKGNLVQLVFAVQNFDMAHNHFPAGVKNNSGPIKNEAIGVHHSWLIALLPYLDESSLHRNIDMQKSVYDSENQAARNLTVPTLHCPSDGSTGTPRSSYAGCHHDVEAPIDANNHGVLFLNSQITAEDIRDGLSQTLLLGEKRSGPSDLGWMSGTRSTLRNTGTPINVDPWKASIAASRSKFEPEDEYSDEFYGVQDFGDSEDEVDNKEADEDAEKRRQDLIETAEQVAAANGKTKLSVGGFGSQHGGGAHLAFSDGRIQFMVSSVNASVLQQLGHRDDGQLLDPEEYRE